MYNNKIVNLYAKKYIVMSILWLGMAITAFGTMNKYSNTDQELTTFPDGSIGYDNSLDALSVMLIFVCLFMSYYGAVAIPKHARKYVDGIANQYLSEEIAKNSQFKEYEYLLKNPKAMKNIIDVLSEEFDESEIIKMVTIVQNINKDKTKTEEQKEQVIKKALLGLVKEHELRDPEFINKIWIQLARNSYTYPIVFQNQNSGR